MKPQDEERITRWIDGDLPDSDVEDLLAAHPELRDAKSQSESLGNLLRKELDSGEKIPYADFFNHQLMKRIEEGDESPASTPAEKEALAESLFPRFTFFKKFAAFAAIGVAAVGVAAVSGILLFSNVQVGGSEIVSTYTPDPKLEAKTFFSDEANATVLLIEGLDEIPAQREVTGVQAVGYVPHDGASHFTLYSTSQIPMLVLALDNARRPHIHELKF
jgi:hypothetical protein